MACAGLLAVMFYGVKLLSCDRNFSGVLGRELNGYLFNLSCELKRQRVVDLYEHIAFLGDINQQIATLPDGAEVRLVIGKKPE